jgi:hypothetical protein
MSSIISLIESELKPRTMSAQSVMNEWNRAGFPVVVRWDSEFREFAVYPRSSSRFHPGAAFTDCVSDAVETARAMISVVPAMLKIELEAVEKLRIAQSCAFAPRTWRRDLSFAWSSGNYRRYGWSHLAGDLQYIRNRFGPEWLAQISITERIPS